MEKNGIDTFEDMLKYYTDIISLISDSTDDFIYVWDIKNDRLYLSPSITEHYNINLHHTFCSLNDWLKLIYAADAQAIQQDFELIKSGKIHSHNTEYRVINKKKEKIWVSCRGKCVPDNAVIPSLMVGRISENAVCQKSDRITGLLNLTQLSTDFSKIIQKHTHVYLLIIGIDNFKNVNEKYGKLFGDYVLKIFSSIIEEHMSESEHVYRLDGDKFGILFFTKKKEIIKTFYQRVKFKFIESCMSLDENVYCSISAGCSVYPQDSSKFDELLKYAESSLSLAKTTGKSNLIFFSIKNYKKQQFQLELHDELLYSIKNNFQGFSIFYQPQVYFPQKTLHGAEALLRWTSKKYGPISPEKFIPILEQTGLILPVGNWVLKESMKQCKIWRKTFPDFRISINLSYIQLKGDNLVNVIAQYLEELELSGDAVTLELTESVQLQNFFYFNQKFYLLSQKGISIAIDDFGTGYSSLSYLKYLNVDIIKIDKCFINEIQNSEYNYKLVNSIIDLAHTVGIEVCVEGTETFDEIHTLENLSPDHIQGFYYGKPVNTEEFTKQYISISKEKKDSLFSSHTEEKKKKVPSSKNINPNNFLNMIESLDEIIYVSDPKNYSLYYINKLGRKLTGVYDYKGRKCYEVLQGRTTPCDFCTNHLIRKNNFYSWEYNNPYLQRHFILRDKLIPWDGTLARMEIAIDITEKENLSTLTKEKLKMENAIVRCFQLLVEYEDLDYALKAVLRNICEFHQASRGLIFEINPSESTYSNTYEWARKDVPEQIQNLQDKDLNLICEWMDKFMKKETILIDDVKHLQSSSPKGFEEMQLQNISSILITPIFEGDSIKGFIRIDNPEYLSTDYTFLNTISYVIVSEIKQRKLSDSLFYMSYHDALTGLYNRNCYTHDIDYLKSRNLITIGIIFADVNGLKKVNDQKGHDAGDILIKEVASILKSIFQYYEIYRIGGDEFVCMCPNIPEDEFLQNVKKAQEIFQHHPSCSVSIGYVWSDENIDVNKLISSADQLMYKNKQDYYKNNEKYNIK